MTSGDLLADRRMEMARALHERGDPEAALDVLTQALELAPAWVAGRFLLGEWQEKAGARDAAVDAYRSCLAQDPADRMGAVLRLALLGAMAEPPLPPPAYVAGVFDDYAETFESALVERLGYRVPEELHRLVTTRPGGGTSFARVLDLGCGTGLAGERFRGAAAWLEGVDLSEGMVAVARRKALYDLLEVGEAVGFAARHRSHYDLVLAADVLVYLGDLVPLVGAVARALVPGGCFAFSVEATAGDGFRLTAGHRYAHSEAYLRSVIEEAGLAVLELRPSRCRLEAGRPVDGLMVLAARSETVIDAEVPARLLPAGSTTLAPDA